MVNRTNTVIVRDGLRYHSVPKVASSTISRVIRKGATKQEYPEDEGPEYRFMVVRHPLDRIVSFYHFFIKDREWIRSNGLPEIGYHLDMSFEECTELLLEKSKENIHTQEQIDFKGPYDMDLLVKLESLEEIWPRLQDRFHWLGNIGHFHKTNRNPWQEYFSKELRNKAEDKFSSDIELYEGAI